MLKLLLRCHYSFLILILLVRSYTTCAQLTYNELSVQYDSPWVFKKLQLIPIRFKNIGKDSGYINNKMFDGKITGFNEAMRKHKIIVKEVNEGGADVSTLMIKNKSNENIMLMNGEMVQGGKQDRAFGETTIIPKGRKKKLYTGFLH